jgi:FkbM family methyltransferase
MIIDSILNRTEFMDNPPVLIDIGSSGGLNSAWKKLAKYSICIAFDPDKREMQYLENGTRGFRKLIVFDRIVTDQNIDELNFFLTASPFCSSTLEPETDKLNDWYFRSLFEVEKKVQLKSITLQDVLNQTNLKYIDWFKSDTQGTDLRLFRSLPDNIRDRVLLAEFEPGIIDAYRNEDKLFQTMAFMDNSNFWLSDFKIKGTQRIPYSWAKTNSKGKNYIISRTLTTSPCWGELTYMNRLCTEDLTSRNYLLAYVFAVIQEQFGFALEIALKFRELYTDSIGLEMEKEANKYLNKGFFKLPSVLLSSLRNKIKGFFQ